MSMDAHAWDARYAAEDLVWTAAPNATVAAEVADLVPGRALDLAGGEGRNAIWLAQRGWQVELVEFSSVALQKAARRADEAEVDLTLTEADVTRSSPLATADLVLQAYLQVSRAASTRATRLAASLVAPEGTLLIVAHARRNLTDGVGGPPDPDLLRTVDEIRDDLSGTGLVIEVAREITRPVETDDGSRDAIDLVVRARRPHPAE